MSFLLCGTLRMHRLVLWYSLHASKLFRAAGAAAAWGCSRCGTLCRIQLCLVSNQGKCGGDHTCHGGPMCVAPSPMQLLSWAAGIPSKQCGWHGADAALLQGECATLAAGENTMHGRGQAGYALVAGPISRVPRVLWLLVLRAMRHLLRPSSCHSGSGVFFLSWRCIGKVVLVKALPAFPKERLCLGRLDKGMWLLRTHSALKHFDAVAAGTMLWS